MKRFSFLVAHFLILLAFLAVVNYALVLLVTGYRYTHIVIHHSAGSSGNYASIKDYHTRYHGWRDAAYHLILSNGSTNVPRGRLEATERYQNLSYSMATSSPKYNVIGVHICVVGNYSKEAMPGPIKASLAHAVRSLQQKFHIPDESILFHRDINPTECPGRLVKKNDFMKWLGTLSDQCPAEVQKQQNRTIRQAGFSINTLPGWILALLAANSLFIITLWLFVFMKIKRRSRSKIADVLHRKSMLSFSD